ncbi:MAG: hypothetical protein Q7T55_15540 [Solirubrobacteraceae bacterium]|nr:hypothetical protein [Solirubrobacteraceae bacterium]
MSTVRDQPSDDVVVTHPNRDSASSKTTRAVVLLFLAASAILSLAILVLSWGVQMGAFLLWVLLTALYAYYAYAVSQWRSGVLPVAAGTALITGVFAAVSVSSWFNRGGDGYDQPAVPESVIGVLVFAFAVMQLVTVVLCLRGFMQNWHVELEVPRSELRDRGAYA